MTATRHGVTARLGAVLALAASAALAVVIVVFVIRNGAYIALGIVGFVLAVGGGWWAVTERGTRRLLGSAAVLVAAALIAWGILGANDLSWAWVVRLAVTLLLVATALVAGRASLLAALSDAMPTEPTRRDPPSHAVLLCNPWSGGGKVCEHHGGAARSRSDPGQGMTKVSCVRFVDRFPCCVTARAGQTELT
jgi:hypothetical protein